MLWSPRLSLANFHVKLTAKGLFRNLQLLPGCRKNTMVFQAGLLPPFSHHYIHHFNSPSVRGWSDGDPGIMLTFYLLYRRLLPLCLMGERAFSSIVAHTTPTPSLSSTFPPLLLQRGVCSHCIDLHPSSIPGEFWVVQLLSPRRVVCDVCVQRFCTSGSVLVC